MPFTKLLLLLSLLLSHHISPTTSVVLPDHPPTAFPSPNTQSLHTVPSISYHSSHERHRKRLPRVRLRHLLEKHEQRALQWKVHINSRTSSRKLLQEGDDGYYPGGSADYVHSPTNVPSVMRSVSTEPVDGEEAEEEDTDEPAGVEYEAEGEEETEPDEEPSKIEQADDHVERVHEKSKAVSVAKTIRAASQASPTKDKSVTKQQMETIEKESSSDNEGQVATKKESASGGVKSFQGLDSESSNGVNIKQLSLMVFKIIKQYDVRSLIDMPCRATLEWFPELLHRLDFEVVGFKYYCVDTDHHSQDDIRPLFSDAGSPEFLHIRPEEAHLLPKTDMVFSWDGPQQWGVKKTWSFFTALREIRPTYLMITNNPGVPNTNDRRGLLNLRKQPFHFAQALRVISHVHEAENPKQLLLYEMDRIRRGF